MTDFHVPDSVLQVTMSVFQVPDAVLQVKMSVFHVPDTCGLATLVAVGALLLVKMSVFHVPNTLGGRFAGKNECFSCSGYIWGPFCR